MINSAAIAALSGNDNFRKTVSELYTEVNGSEYQTARYQELYGYHSEHYGEEVRLYSSPGRIELCGNHTDHNNGKVLCASISVDTIACVTPNNDGVIVVDSIGYPPVKVNINELEKKRSEEGKSEALVKGVCRFFVNNGLKIGGFYASTTSDVFKGAGVSSSASFEVLVSEILNSIYNEGKVDAITRAKASHYAESVYFGKPCGLLDQSAISLGGVSYIDFKNTKEPKVQSIDWKFENVDIVLVNTGGNHADLTHHYADIRVEMEEVARVMHKKKLRAVKESDFYAALPSLQHEVDGRSILRAMHFFDENKRVTKAASAIKRDNFKKFAEAINASGDSSYTLLQNCYPYDDRKQRVPLGINLSKHIDGVKAVRVHGGGFAGTILAFVDKSATARYTDEMKRVFGDSNVFVIGIRNCGTREIEL